jgi:hypothetical protein
LRISERINFPSLVPDTICGLTQSKLAAPHPLP